MIMYRKILVAYDGSDGGTKAFDTALQLAKKHGAELHVLSVSSPPDIGDDVESEAIIEHSREYHRKRLEHLKDTVEKTGVSARFEVVVGHPAEQSIYYADRQGVD